MKPCSMSFLVSRRRRKNDEMPEEEEEEEEEEEDEAATESMSFHAVSNSSKRCWLTFQATGLRFHMRAASYA